MKEPTSAFQSRLWTYHPSFSVQTISGTGANHLGALFLTRFYTFNGNKQIYLSNPTWGEQTTFTVPTISHSHPLTSPVFKPITTPFSETFQLNRWIIHTTIQRPSVSISEASFQLSKRLPHVPSSSSMHALTTLPVLTPPQNSGTRSPR